MKNQPKQQGDVTLIPVSQLPKSYKSLSKGRCVLAEGEATGHYHVVEDDEAELIADGERILLSLGKQATLTHEEHKPITLEPGIWEIGRINEYNYFDKMVSKVQD